MSEQPIQDVNDGKPWSEMDLFDLRNRLGSRAIDRRGGGIPLSVWHSRGSEA
jgi:hypothetical protein